MKKTKVTNIPVKTDFCCPFCDKPLYRQWGSQTRPGDRAFGVTLYCPFGDPEGATHPQEVHGHANFKRVDEREEQVFSRAYGIIRARFCGAKLESDGEPVEIRDAA